MDVLIDIVQTLFQVIKSIFMLNPEFSTLFILAIITWLIMMKCLKAFKEWHVRKVGMRRVDKMSGRKFEKYLYNLLKSKGYKVKLTPESGDYGADLVLRAKRKHIVIQAKRYKQNVGVKAVQEIVSAKGHYEADECWVITNSHFTKQAKQLAQSNEVILIERQNLINWQLGKEDPPI